MFRNFIILAFFAANAAAQGGGGIQKMELIPFSRLRGQFQQTKLIKELKLELKSEGSFEINRKNEQSIPTVYWNAVKPKLLAICIDELGMVVESGAGATKKKKTLQFSEVGKETGEQIGHFLRLLTLDQKRIGQEFTVFQKEDKFILDPKNKEKSFFEKAEIKVVKGLVHNLWIFEKSGDQIYFEFSGHKISDYQETPSCAR
ncbi:MAG: outer-membrane lipoprotein carrier protein LolA [Pseudobdellovibrionaceae bacterium]